MCAYAGWVVLALVIAFLVYLRLLRWFGRRTTVAGAGAFLEWPIGWGHAGSRVRIKRPGSKQRIDFLKTIPPRGRARFDMVLDSRRFSESEFREAQTALRRRGIRFRLFRNRSRQSYRLLVECDCDVDLARAALRSVLTEGLGLSLDTPLRVSHKGEFDVDRTRNPMIGWDARDNNGASQDENAGQG